MSEQKTTAVSIQQMQPAEIVKASKGAFIAAGGDEQQFAKECGFALQLFRVNNYLTQMDKQSIYDAIVNVALTGLTLNPELRLGYLIPYKGRLYFRSSYMGKREILIRSGMVLDVWAELVYERDTFIVEQGTTRSIKHQMPEAGAFSDRGQLIGGYWVATLTNGTQSFGIMPRQEVDEIMKRSESFKSGKGSPWVTDYTEMFKKTLINRAYKNLPKTGISENVLRVLEADGELDRQELDDYVRKQSTPTVDLIEDDRPDDEGLIEDDRPDDEGLIQDAEIVNDK